MKKVGGNPQTINPLHSRIDDGRRKSNQIPLPYTSKMGFYGH
jgi:hypothetical protein